MDVPTIVTDRLVLRPFAEQDAEPLYHILAEEGVLRYFPNPAPPPPDRVGHFVAHQIIDGLYLQLQHYSGVLIKMAVKN